LDEARTLDTFAETLSAAKAGIAEVVVPPGSKVIGKSIKELWFRKTTGLTPLVLNRGGDSFQIQTGEYSDLPFQAGDTLVCHTQWEALARLESNRDYVIVTTDFPHENLRPKKVIWALFFFLVALSLVLFWWGRWVWSSARSCR
jgi:di/tricarboxylate transporter